VELAVENFDDFFIRNIELENNEIIDLFIIVCEGIEHAHNKGVVHRDIWRNNVLMKNQQYIPVPKISDIGRSRDFNSDQLTSLPPEKWGLIHISQPELFFRYWDMPTQQNYILGDIYALGVLLYYSLEAGPLSYSSYFISRIYKYLKAKKINNNCADEKTRQNAYKHWLTTIKYTDLDILRNIRNISSNDYAFAKKIDVIIKKMCEPDFSKRYQSVSELLIELRKI
jgi:serine/threonine protein kinase